MMLPQQGSDTPVANLVQRLLTRMDHLEFNLIKRSQDDVSQLRDRVDVVQRAQTSQVGSVHARAHVPASHRGEGTLPPPSNPAPSTAQALTPVPGPEPSPTAGMAEGAPVFTEAEAEATAEAVQEVDLSVALASVMARIEGVVDRFTDVPPGPSRPDDILSQTSSRSGPRGAFTNALVKSRPTRVTLPQRFEIATPTSPPGIESEARPPPAN